MIQERYKLWAENPYFDEETRAELSRLQDPKEIEDRFYTDLEFGTGGLRGILAAGRNRMNKYVVRKVTQGLADLIAEYGQRGRERGVVIAYDSRRFSPEFAREAALVLARNGIKAYLFESLRPTPELSFAVRHLHTLAGIVITASHNPKEYNGYKVYWEDGGQVPPEQANRILAKIQEREDWLGIEPLAEDEARRQKLLVMIGEEIDRAYLKKVQTLSIHPELNLKSGNKLKIIYTPLHGAGTMLVRKALAQAGFHSVFVVPEQEKPDSEFTTVPFPNPEIPSTFDLARSYALEQGADLILATDPDADRLGVAVRAGDGSYVQLTGNQAGVILMHYILGQKQALGTLPAKAAVIKTIASTDLADEVARSFKVKVENVLTGFKFIAEKVHEMEEEGWGQFQFGFEESYGYLAGTFVRDKDGIIAAVLLAEAALYYKINGGRTLLDVIEDIYTRFGYYIEDQKSFTLEGIEGKEQMAKIMHHLRSLEFREIGGIPVERIDDYEQRFGKRWETGEVSILTLPRSDVLRFSFRGGGFVMARPSGTEPKIKFYFSIKEEKREGLEETLQRVKEDILARVQEV
ncbi:phospho-sugar mutase [Paradesulfitobacterium ferrireducens]|uniref:phospho-sugar mutase n=1 Tax=Paradesulfitobacterium ferrireducens TaxID=2816476 RepID=UPI001A8C90AB|nr:phospho-sugar mutase [Paradesulfitobacterium ferrireducens]